MSKLTDTYTIPNGVQIPQVGFGTWQIPAGETTYNAVKTALATGYRHIDTAAAYQNEAGVGQAVRDSGIARSDIFVTSKLPAEAKSYTTAMAAFEQTMTAIGLDYLDLYLIHAPWPWAELGADYKAANVEVWRAMEDIYKSGRVRAIGISNFNVADIENVVTHATIKPMALQLQYYIGYTERDIVACARQHGMLVEGFSPLATGFLIGNADVAAIAAKYNVTVAQIAICYVLQNGVLPLPKAVNPAHIQANTKLDFTISAEDMAFLDTLEDTAPGEDNNAY